MDRNLGNGSQRIMEALPSIDRPSFKSSSFTVTAGESQVTCEFQVRPRCVLSLSLDLTSCLLIQ